MSQGVKRSVRPLLEVQLIVGLGAERSLVQIQSPRLSPSPRQTATNRDTAGYSTPLAGIRRHGDSRPGHTGLAENR